MTHDYLQEYLKKEEELLLRIEILKEEIAELEGHHQSETLEEQGIFYFHSK